MELIHIDEVYKIFKFYKDNESFREFWKNTNNISEEVLKDISFYHWCEIYKNRYNYKITGFVDGDLL